MKNEMYPYTVVMGKKKLMIMWVPTDKLDTFKLQKDGKLFIAKNKKEAVSLLGKESSQVKWKEEALFDLNVFWRKVNSLRVGRSSSVGTCEVLLDGWNFVEDFLRTFSMTELLEESQTRVLKKVYDKLFFGNNLKAITPKGASYHPLWSKTEIQKFKAYMKRTWSEVEEHLVV